MEQGRPPLAGVGDVDLLGVVTTGAPRVMRTGNPGSVIVIVVTSGQGWVRGGELVSVADQEGGYLPILAVTARCPARAAARVGRSHSRW